MAATYIGAYELQGELARGGMGVIYTARDTRVDRRVALKLMLRRGQASLKRFEQEAALVARLQHPNVIKVHDVGMTPEGHPWFAMELVDGESLEDKLAREGPMDAQTAAGLAETLAHALAHAHERSVIHRDLKPANVLLTREGRPLLTDFGVARELSEERERLTRSGAMIGTPGFMPPEQANGTKEIGAPADVYGLGATLYAMLTGRAPFEGATLMALMVEIERSQPLPPSRVSPGLDRRLDAIVLKCLAKDPDLRYASASDLAEDLSRYLRGESVEAQVPVNAARRNLGLLVGLGLLALALAAGIAKLVLAEPRRPQVAVKAEARPAPPAPPKASPDEQLARLEGLTGAAYQHRARAWLTANPDHARAREVRLAYLQAGLTAPRQVFTLFFAEPIAALTDDHAYGLRTGTLFPLRGRSKDKPKPIGPWPGEKCRRVIDRAHRRVIAAKGLEVRAISVGAPASLLFKIEGNIPIRRLALAPRGDLLALTVGDETVRLYALPSARRVKVIPLGRNEPDEMWFSGDGAVLVTQLRSNRLKTWDVAGGKLLGSHKLITAPTCRAQHPTDPRLMAAGFPLSNQIVLFEHRGFKAVGELFGDGVRVSSKLVTGQRAAHRVRPNAVAFDPGARWVYGMAGEVGGASPGEIRVWDAAEARQVAFVEHRQGVLSADVSPNGERLVTLSKAPREMLLEVWEVGVAEGAD